MAKDTTDFVCLGPLDKIPMGQGSCFIVNQERVAVFRARSGELYAIQDRCPHRRGPLSEGIIDNCKVICPYHGHKFDLNDGSGSEPGESVKTYEVHEENGEIFLRV
jgi:nitrite reductase (NADH) small subunit